jgi:hypothetical protein
VGVNSSGGKPAVVHDHAGVELDVGVELAAGLELGQHLDHRGLDLLGEVDLAGTDALGHAPEEQRPRVVGLVDAVAEAHDLLAPLDGVDQVGAGVVLGADGLEHVEGPAGRPAVQRARQRTDATDHGGSQVGAGGGDDPRRERGGVEAVVDGGHLVLLDGPGQVGIGDLAGEHVEVVGAVGQVGVRVDGVEALVEPVERHDQRGDHGAHLHGVGPQLVGLDVEAGLEVLGERHQRHRRAQGVERREGVAARGDGRQQGPHRLGDLAEGTDLGEEGVALGRRGQLALEEQVPDVLQRALLAEVDGAVLPVVVEALHPPHVADLGLGHDHPLEPRRGLDLAGVDHRLDLGDAHQVAHGHDAGEAAVLDHGDVAVVALDEGGEGALGALVGAHGVGIAGHPLGDLGDRGLGTRRREADEVALGEDADGPVAVDHDHRAHLALVHAGRDLGDGLAGGGGDGGPAHDLADRADLGSCGHGRVSPLGVGC